MEDTDPRPPDTLPSDVVHQILLSLPVKSLVRFRAVCKSWNFLFSDPRFHEEHYKSSLQRPLLFTARYKFDDISMTRWMCLSIYNNKEALIRSFSRTGQIGTSGYPIQSCRGLVCMASIKEHNVVIVNPSTEEVLVLPPVSPPRILECIGFGHIASRDEFKVARFFYYAERQQCEVFTLGDNFWTSAKPPPYSVRSGYAPFLHGALHLLPLMTSYFDLVQYLATFDIESEEFREIQLPECYCGKVLDPERITQIFLTELGGSLWLNFNDLSKKLLEIWLLKNYESGEWEKAYNIDFSLQFNSVGYVQNVWPLVITGNGTILVQVEMDGENKIFRYNSREKYFSPWLNNRYCSATFYAESFFPLHRPNQKSCYAPTYKASDIGARQTFKDYWGKHSCFCLHSCNTSMAPTW